MQEKCAVCGFVEDSVFQVIKSIGESCLAASLLRLFNHIVSIYFVLISVLVLRVTCSFTTMSFVLLQGIDLENIVYYKDDTHYFVMTAKKQSLLEKGVIRHVGVSFFCVLYKLKIFF